MLVGKLVRVRSPSRSDTHLRASAPTIIAHLLVPTHAIIGRDSRVIAPWHIFDVEGSRLAFRTDISYGCGSLLIHHLHALALA